MASSNGNGSASTRWMQLVPAVATGSAIVGAMITFYVNTTSLSVQVSGLTARTSSLEANYNQMAEREMILRTANAEMQSALIKIETEFCSEDDMRNLMDEHLERSIAVLWRKLNPESEFPASTYFPHVCNRMPGTGAASTR
jgi:hypothetical protein